MLLFETFPRIKSLLLSKTPNQCTIIKLIHDLIFNFGIWKLLGFYKKDAKFEANSNTVEYLIIITQII